MYRLSSRLFLFCYCFRQAVLVIIDILLGVPVLVYRLCQVAVAIVGIGLCPALRVRAKD